MPPDIPASSDIPANSDKSADAPEKKKRRSTIPRWARICVIVGAVLMVASGGLIVTSQALLARYEGAVTTEDLFGEGTDVEPKSDIKGPLNILLVGIDPREEKQLPLADSIMIMHIPAGLDRGYLFSLPRDLVVEIPPFPKAGFDGGRDRLNSAMARGSRVPGGSTPDRARGFELLSNTVSRYTGIERFDAGAIVNFNGFKKIVDAMGGVTMTVDQDVVYSEHMTPDGKHRPNNGCGCEHPYYGPQAKYTKGTHTFSGWQALDYVRQRYTVKDGDYGRQRHQQQFVKAMAQQALSKDVLTDFPKLDRVIRAAGESLVFNGRGHSVAEFALALRGMRQDSITMVKLKGGTVRNSSGSYAGEALQPEAKEFFAALAAGTADAFIAANPDMVNR
ncbi:LCP family protein [Asanoa siamensis]|uniref:LytTR family transcriptional regulator n=1 Tax=Asanoa siamensis TaxID=926357 RepID=A0ABQ4CUI9_9ACTN|nr:LCP family protein [Asanoa siamensis]GIF74939.1 LytTR family transcriptional regulator [Asanoa siamensis]